MTIENQAGDAPAIVTWVVGIGAAIYTSIKGLGVFMTRRGCTLRVAACGKNIEKKFDEVKAQIANNHVSLDERMEIQEKRSKNTERYIVAIASKLNINSANIPEL